MIRGILSALSSRAANSFSVKTFTNKSEQFCYISKLWRNQQSANFTSSNRAILSSNWCASNFIAKTKLAFLEPPQVFHEQIRTVIKFSLNKGRRKSVRPVHQRFFRLHWGIWIRTIAGRKKKLWKKSYKQKNFYLNHVFCNATQSRMLDKMVNKFWRKPKYYIEDPYEPYHKRENFKITQTKPWRPEGVDYE